MGFLLFAFATAFGALWFFVFRSRWRRRDRLARGDILFLSLGALALAVFETVFLVADGDLTRLPLAAVGTAAFLWLLWRASNAPVA